MRTKSSTLYIGFDLLQLLLSFDMWPPAAECETEVGHCKSINKVWTSHIGRTGEKLFKWVILSSFNQILMQQTLSFMNFEHAKVKLFLLNFKKKQSEIFPRWLNILREDYFLQLCEAYSFRLLHKCDCFYVVAASCRPCHMSTCSGNALIGRPISNLILQYNLNAAWALTLSGLTRHCHANWYWSHIMLYRKM